ncbi:MAG: hypothetical protein MJZ08_02445 [Bacteroidaceae bacterium]|nr:hypothetical protein [Bacteroidaceae bacterium]
MNTLSAVRHLYAYDDGDVIIPQMGVSMASGYGIAQYINLDTGNINPDFETHHPTIYPLAYSSKRGDYVDIKRGSGEFSWAYNVPTNVITFGSDGISTGTHAGTFKSVTIQVNGKTYPALQILKNLISDTDYTDKNIYFIGYADGNKAFTSSQLFPMQSTAGSTYYVLLNMVGADGIQGDNVLSNGNDYCQVTPSLQEAGVSVSGTVTYQFQKLVKQNNNWVWQNITSESDVIEVTSSWIKIYEAAVDGVVPFRVVATYNGSTYYQEFEITDIHDPYYIYDGCSLGGDNVRRSETARFEPKVIRRENGVDVTVSEWWTFNYAVYAKNDTERETPIQHGDDVSVFSVTGATVADNNGVTVVIEAIRDES